MLRVVARGEKLYAKNGRMEESGIHSLDGVEISSNALLWVLDLPFHDLQWLTPFSPILTTFVMYVP